ncbi:hypothetical protein [Streptomyces sp. H39-C1]|uniref:hypothetical protein n=1 Tax=Streptomyces sp. H39-C1 TaxID=3004355 RepID=UPI0022AEE098|nr:hypothetical protein [Streptomyces sp. H39-C1]MCZ4102657.1 hypothetical protein [Streptomyces sp. H39-C1]
MSPRPEPEVRKALKDRVAAALIIRDVAKEEAERTFWTGIAAELDTGYFGAQADIAEALDLTRDYIRKSVQRYAPPVKKTTAKKQPPATK